MTLYWIRHIGLDRYARALNPFSHLSWPIRLRLLLIIPGSHPWNARIRDWTAKLEGREDQQPAVLGIPTEDGVMSIRDWVNEGAYVDAEGRTRRGRRPMDED